MAWMLLAGALAGALTTLTGMGGGLLLTLVLLAVLEPAEALTISSPALLLGNLHRAMLYRADVSWPAAGRYALGALPGALLGGLVAVSLPATAVRGLAALLAVFVTIRLFTRVTWTPPPGTLVPGGALTGFVSATSGGGGLLHGPLLLSTGLSGRAYVGTGAVGALAVHVGRLGGYGLGGWVHTSLLLTGLGIAVALLAGNVVGHVLRQQTPEAWVPRLEVAVVLTCAFTALLGVT